MAISDMLLQEFDQEMAGARKTLERVPDDRLEWVAAREVRHDGLARRTPWQTVPSWTVRDDWPRLAGISHRERQADGVRRRSPRSSAELVATLDRHAAEARAAIAGASDEELMQPWSLLQNGQVMMTLPRLAVLRSFVFNHLIHHRAQLGVYLRLNDIPVPSIYGPSADENPSGF